MIEDFEHPNGKFADSYGNVIIFDSQHLLPNLVDSFTSNVLSKTGDKLLFEDTQKLMQKIFEVDINEYAMQVDGIVTHRESRYFSK